MQTAAIAALGLQDEFEYGRVAVAPGEFEATVRDLPAQGFAGVNVTIPHKEAALADRGEHDLAVLEAYPHAAQLRPAVRVDRDEVAERVALEQLARLVGDQHRDGSLPPRRSRARL